MKPSKPTPDFPLFPHASGKWAKKINGKLRYFGRWEDPQGALQALQEALGSPPAAKPDTVTGLTIQDACNAFLTAKEAALHRGELRPRSFMAIKRTCLKVADVFGRGMSVESLTPADFARYRDHRPNWNVVSMAGEIVRVRSLFKWCHDSRLIKEPIHFGPEFKPAGSLTLRRHRRLAGKKLYTAEQIQTLLDHACIHMRAMILLGINCGFGPGDCANLPISAVQGSWIDYPRPKTEVERLIPLWPETVEALRLSDSRRPKPGPNALGRFFVRVSGEHWDDAISKRFQQIYNWAGFKRGGFYWLRHTFETVAGDSRDQVAVNAIMGHVDSSMAAVYREGLDPARLQAVVDHVRKWLYA